MKKIFSSIDIGSDSIKIVVCEYFQNKLNVLASIKKSSSGIENGIIIDKERAKMSINEALKDINSSLGVKIDKAIINVPMYDSEYMVNEGSTTITNENKVVTGNDMVNALQGSIYNKIPKSRELVTIQPIKYNVDDEKKDLLNPRGIRADKLYVTSMCMTVPKKNIYVVISILQELNIEVIDILFGIIGDYYEFKNKEILKLEKLKYDFFKGASHELKTPLASLKIILENMKYNIGKYKERDIYINECIEIVDSLTKNISQILSVHSIENLNNDEEYLKINDTLEDILKKYEILANQKKITVNNYILDENVYIGKTALKIILSNLISNAVKYTDVNGVINIGIVNDWLYIENTYGNNKISNMDKIFDVKFDLNKENSNGLGLYIVSNILNNYNN